MRIENDLPVRKNIRLKDYDYSKAGYYFITICVKDKRELLASIDVGTNCVRPSLSAYGKIVDNEISVLENAYETVDIDKYVIIPNHIHMIIILKDEQSSVQKIERTQFVPTISRIIKQFKGSITKKLGFSLWQPRFHDHIIRDDNDYRRIWQYIDENPARWVDDDYYSEPI